MCKTVSTIGCLGNVLRNFLLLAPLLVMPATAQDSESGRLNVNERAYLAGKVYAAVTQYFAHWADVPDLDVDAAYRQYLDQALASDDRLAFGRATMEFLATFRNGHTMLFDRALVGKGGSLPFAARFVAGKWVVTDAWTPDLKSGDAIDSIDGQPFEEFFTRCRRFISASTMPFARRALFGRLPASILFPQPFALYAHLLPERFVLRLEGGRQVSVDRHLAVAPAPMATEGRWLDPGRLAYIRIPSFFAPEYEKRAIELIHEFHSAAALIIDVRGNMGGSTPSDLTSLLMDRPYRWWTESTPVEMPHFRFLASQGKWEYRPFSRPELIWRSSFEQPNQGAFKGKLALLVDAGCHSACEDFAIPFKDNRRASLIGELTGGSSGQPYLLDLGHDMMIMVGAKREMFPDGSRFEGVGIKPDLEASPSADDIRQGRDPALELARKHLAGS